MESVCRRNLLWAYGDNDGMSGIVTACTASADVDVGSKDVDKFALAFVTPLRAQNDGHCISMMIN